MKNVWCKFGFHKWKYVPRQFKRTFMGVTYSDSYNRFRVCEVCGQAEQWYGGCYDWGWERLSKHERRILKEELANKSQKI